MKKIQNTKKRIGAFLMLSWLAFFAASGIAVFAAPALSQPVQLSFDGTTATNLSVIRGVNITITATNTADRAPLSVPIKLVKNYESGTQREDHTKYFKISGEKHRMVLHPYLRDELVSADDKKNAPENNYTITSNYGTMKWEADIANQIDSSGRAAGKLNLVDDSGRNGLNILTDSYIKMKYQDGKFTLIKDADTRGVFLDFSVDVFNDTTKFIEGNSTKNEKFFLTMYENQVTDSSSAPQVIPRVFEFEPRQSWSDLDADGNKVMHYNIQDGSIYEIRYQFVTSYPLTLTVMDPEKVLKDICSGATNTDFKTNEYIIPTDTTNINSFITNKLSLKSSIVRHGQEVQLSWKWIPNNPNPTEAEKGAVTLETTAGKPTIAEVTRLVDDVAGILRVTAVYSASDLNRDVPTTVQSDLAIVIKGRGTPASINTITGYVGHGVEADTTIAIKSTTQNLPRQIEMNVYKNDVTGYPETALPYMAEFYIETGAANGRATQMFVDLLKADGSIYTEKVASATMSTKDGTRDYVFGAALSTKDLPNVTFKLYGNKSADGLKLRFRFFVPGPAGDREEIDSRVEIPITIHDTTPDVTALLNNISITSNNIAVPGFKFSKDITTYDLAVPYKASQMVLTPIKYANCHEIIGLKVEVQDDMALWKEATINDGWISKDTVTKDWVVNWDDQSKKDYSIKSGQTLTVNPNPGKTIRVSFTVRAQHPKQTKTYIVNITKALPSTNSFLKTITFADENGKNLFTTKLVDGQYDYTFEVPYKTKYLQIVPTPQDTGAVINNDPANGLSDYNPSLDKRTGMVLDQSNWWRLNRPSTTPGAPEVSNQMKIKVNAEDKDNAHASNYVFTVNYSRPSTDSSLNKLTLTDNKKATIAYTPTFHADMQAGDYYMATVPFEVDTINVLATPTNSEATHQLVYTDLETGTIATVDMSRTNPTAVKLPILPNLEAYYEFKIKVTAEDMGTTTEYPIRIHRVPPSKEASLSSLVIKDEANKDLSATSDYSFNTEKLSYSFTVPYETRKVSFTPTASFDNVKAIKVAGLTIPNKTQSGLQILGDASVPTTFEVEVFPQDVSAPSKIYYVTITRQAPSTDARLKGLVLTGVEDFKPMFTPNQMEYSAKISKGGGAIITATTNHPFATLSIRGVSATSGTATDPITLMELNETVSIIVTAQDGTTTKEYKIALTDLNLVELSNNADLKDLQITPGVPTPTLFQSSVTDYKVAVAEEVASVKVLPVPADPAASYKVFAGSKEIGDFSGNYASAIADGENPFKIQVTSPDGKNKKEYTVNVYRNDDENAGILKPITPDDVNYDIGNPVVVDISKYSRVSAEVFTTLRDKYPDKTIVFEGNDYSLSFKASELSKNIPITTIYDFSLKFSVPSPTDAALNQVLQKNPQNALLDIVYLTFSYHGDLPGPANLNISLGQKYGNRTMYWHYFNEERARVDYYGKFNTNSRGTAGIKLTHMSTYMASTAIIYGAEDRSGEINLSPGKNNPNTQTKVPQKRFVK